MTIELSQEVENLARTAATTLGFQSVAAFVEQAVVEKATVSKVIEAPSDGDAWADKLRAIASRHPTVEHPVDDSRESIYPDRS